MYMEKNGSTAMLTAKRLAGVGPKVNLRECVATSTPLLGVNKATFCGFETMTRHHKKSKTGVSVANKKDLYPTKILKRLGRSKVAIDASIWEGYKAFPN